MSNATNTTVQKSTASKTGGQNASAQDAAQNATAQNYGDHAVALQDHARSAETKPSFKTTELIMFLVVAIGTIITAAVVGNGAGGGADHFDAYHAMQLLTFLTIGYMVARGIAKSGSRQPRD